MKLLAVVCSGSGSNHLNFRDDPNYCMICKHCSFISSTRKVSGFILVGLSVTLYVCPSNYLKLHNCFVYFD